MKVFQYSLPRSGSTFIYQVLEQLFSRDDVETSHDDRNLNGRHLVITIRDFRDVLASHWRIWYAKFDADMNVINTPTSQEIMATIRTVKERIVQLNKFCEKNIDYEKTLILDYGDYFGDYDYLFAELEEFFSIEIDRDKRLDIISKTNIDVKRKQQLEIPILDKERIFDNWVDKRDVHANHIHPKLNPIEGYWKQVFHEEFHEMINKELMEELEKWGYINE